jgi:hypothetical protein
VSDDESCDIERWMFLGRVGAFPRSMLANSTLMREGNDCQRVFQESGERFPVGSKSREPESEMIEAERKRLSKSHDGISVDLTSGNDDVLQLGELDGGARTVEAIRKEVDARISK